MKLLELVKRQFQGTAWQKGQAYSLDAKKLYSIFYDLKRCEEFKDRVIQIIDSPRFEIKSGSKKVNFSVKSLNITDRMPLILNKAGTVYLYAIETEDFINYKIRLEIVEEIYGLEGLDEEQTDIIQRLIDTNDTWQNPDYIRNRIDAYRQENEGKKLFEEMTKNDMTDEKSNMMEFVKEQFSIINDKKEKSTNSINGHQLVETMREISEAYAKGEKTDRDEYIEFDNGKAYLNFNGKRSFFSNIEDNRKTYNDIEKDFDSIERGIIECDGLEEEQILILKEKLKTFEAKLKEKEIKPKTITISGSIHNKIKNHCGYIGIKIGDWVEKVLSEAMQPAIITEKLDYNQQEKQFEKQKDDLIQTWIKSKDRNKVIITDKLILLTNFKFLGYESANGKPTYDFIGTEEEFKKAREKIKCNITLAADNKRSLISTYEYKEDNLGELDETAIFISRYK
jgi:hypothetical protein